MVYLLLLLCVAGMVVGLLSFIIYVFNHVARPFKRPFLCADIGSDNDCCHRLYVWHDSCMCVTWLVHVRDYDVVWWGWVDEWCSDCDEWCSDCDEWCSDCDGTWMTGKAWMTRKTTIYLICVYVSHRTWMTGKTTIYFLRYAMCVYVSDGTWTTNHVVAWAWVDEYIRMRVSGWGWVNLMRMRMTIMPFHCYTFCVHLYMRCVWSVYRHMWCTFVAYYHCYSCLHSSLHSCLHSARPMPN